MSKVVVSACVLTLVMFSWEPAYAQDQRVSGNVLFGIGASRASFEPDMLANVGMKATDYISIHAEVATHPFKAYLATSPFLKTKHRAVRYSGNIRFSYAERSLVEPYLTAGVGGVSVKETGGGRSTEFTPNAGLGFDLWPTKYLGFGLHYRVMSIDHGTFHTFTSGLVLGRQ